MRSANCVSLSAENCRNKDWILMFFRLLSIQSCLMAKLGFLGLGLMGAPMARNLLKAGHDVALWSHSGGKAAKIAAEAGGKACATPADVARHAECVFLCVGDSAMSEA